jgi:hypothetical protein
MRIKVETDVTDIRARLKNFTNLMGREISSGVRQFAVVACRNLANTTQPFSGNEKATSEKGRRLGEKAVEVDISKVFYVPTVDGGFSKMLTERAEASNRRRSRNSMTVGERTHKFRERINNYISAGNFTALKKVAEDMGFTNFRRTVDKQIHEAARTGRRRRVQRPVDGMTLILNKKERLDSYVAKRQRMVGFTKAAWAKCADMIPAEKKGSATRGIPQWVTRHKKKASASIVDRSKDPKNPKVIMTNNLSWASNCISPNESRKAVELAKRNFVQYMNRTAKAELRRRARLNG